MSSTGWQASEQDIAAIVAGRHADPFALLGLHETPKGLVLRAFVPGAETLRATEIDGLTTFDQIGRAHV